MSSASAKISVSEILSEFFEVILHNILYTRKLYPETIFVPKKKYGVVVYQSIHPDVNEYISQCLKAVSFHAKNNRLKRLCVCFCSDDIVVEKYVFEVLELTNFVESDPFLVDLEQSLRDFVLKLHSSQNYLEDLPDNATFTVRIETTAYSSLEFNQNPAFEDFPWIELREEGNNCVGSPDIVPIHSVKTSFLSVQMYIEKECEMENAERGVKRKSRLAVFEHVSERQKNPAKKKFRPNRLDLDESSPSESELVIDDEKEEEPVKSKKKPLIRLTEEKLNLHCEWNFCNDVFDSWQKFNAHIINHASAEVEAENLKCRWGDCEVVCTSSYFLSQHVSYHGYLSKLKNIGQNVLDRNDWPSCNLQENYKIPLSYEGYTCRWEYCLLNFCTIHDFYFHMEMHVHNNPRVSNESLNEIIKCCWEGCNIKFSTKYKLAEHVRTHTKEKIIACPTCCTVFSNKTKLCDHRKRQLATDLQSYQCSQCLKLFPSERLLREHMRSHINHYKCTMCDMTCPKPSLLAKHIRFKHIKAKPYKCPSCSKIFVARHNLDTHLKTHNNKKFKCELCDFECRAKISLDSHYAKVHEKASAIYQCHCCKQKFRRGGYLTKHLMKVHNYHWPSGHSRFRYLKDQDGIYRLQTVRYESLEVTQEMIKSESLQSSNKPKSVTYSLKYDNDGKSNYVLSVSDDGEQSIKMTEQESKQQNDSNILITIDDVDEHGNIVRSEIVESGEIVKTVVGNNIIVDSPQGFTRIDEEEGENEGSVEKKRSKGKRRRRKRKVPKKKSRSSPVVEAGKSDVRHFSKEVILNYDKFEIRAAKNE